MKLILNAFVTMDGVMQGPGGTDEDRSNGFDHGGWLVPFADPDMGRIVTAWFERADEFLLGRRTYELFSAFWPRVTDPDDVIARKLNGLPKHVVSRSLRSTDWAHSSVIGDDVAEAVKALKDKPGGELQVHGSAQLAQTLIEKGLVDEYRLVVFPVVLGAGKRLFGDGTVPTSFETVDSTTTGAGAVALTLRPTGAPAQGDFDIQDGAVAVEDLAVRQAPQ
jgi:dihydrofolate reductase